MSDIVKVSISETEEALMVPINRNLAGDFIGFTFDNKHSSDFNLVRVSSGSRYESTLLPSFQDATLQAEGKDGLYYFGSAFKEKSIKISTAFDQLTEKNYRELCEQFSNKRLHTLWFDETPYKVYYVKLKQAPTMKNLCFDEGEGRERIYRGEMDLEFVCYPSFAESRALHVDAQLPDKEFVIYQVQGDNMELLYHNHFLVNSDYTFTGCQFYKFYGKDGATLSHSYNYKEWKEASRLVTTTTREDEALAITETIETFERTEGTEYLIYNPGDKEADIKIIYTPSQKQIETTSTYIFPSTNIILYQLDEEKNRLEKRRIGIKQFNFSDPRIVIDSKTHLIAGLDADYELTGKVYNKYHIVGDFFMIPKSSYSDRCYIKIEGGASEKWQMEHTFYYV